MFFENRSAFDEDIYDEVEEEEARNEVGPDFDTTNILFDETFTRNTILSEKDDISNIMYKLKVSKGYQSDMMILNTVKLYSMDIMKPGNDFKSEKEIRSEKEELSRPRRCVNCNREYSQGSILGLYNCQIYSFSNETELWYQMHIDQLSFPKNLKISLIHFLTPDVYVPPIQSIKEIFIIPLAPSGRINLSMSFVKISQLPSF